MRALQGEVAGIAAGDVDWHPRYHTKFRARSAIVLACINAGWSLEDCELRLIEPTSPVAHLWTRGEDERYLTSGEAYKRLRRDYQRMHKRYQDSPSWADAGEVRQWLGETQAMVNARLWSGRTGRTDRAVLDAAIAVATRVGCADPDLPTRLISLMAGVGRQTASNALARLCAQGWLKRVRESQPSDHAIRYRVRRPEPYCSLGSSRGNMAHLDAPIVSAKVGNPAHECWIRLGKSALAIWLALSFEAVSAYKAAQRAYVSEPTARRQLPVLFSYRLAARAAGGWVSGEATPDDVVKDMGWVGDNSKVEQRQRAYADDRDVYRFRNDPSVKVSLNKRMAALEAKAEAARGEILAELDQEDAA